MIAHKNWYFIQEKAVDVSKKLDKEKKSKVKEQKPHAINGTKKVKAKIQKKAGKGKPEKPPPVQPPSDSDVSVEIQVPFVCFVCLFVVWYVMISRKHWKMR